MKLSLIKDKDGLRKLGNLKKEMQNSKLVFGELPTDISKDIDKLMMKAYIQGKVKI
jgi:hypothetical protein